MDEKINQIGNEIDGKERISMSTKKQHYVPQFYLKNFSDESLQLYVLNKNIKKIDKSSVRDICYRNNLYEIKWQTRRVYTQKFY